MYVCAGQGHGLSAVGRCGVRAQAQAGADGSGGDGGTVEGSAEVKSAVHGNRGPHGSLSEPGLCGADWWGGAYGR